MGEMADWVNDDSPEEDMGREEDVRIEGVECLRQTDKAILCDIDGEEHWIPISQVTDDSEVYEKGNIGDLVITHWIAKQKSLI